MISKNGQTYFENLRVFSPEYVWAFINSMHERVMLIGLLKSVNKEKKTN